MTIFGANLQYSALSSWSWEAVSRKLSFHSQHWLHIIAINPINSCWWEGLLVKVNTTVRPEHRNFSCVCDSADYYWWLNVIMALWLHTRSFFHKIFLKPWEVFLFLKTHKSCPKMINTTDCLISMIYEIITTEHVKIITEFYLMKNN